MNLHKQLGNPGRGRRIPAFFVIIAVLLFMGYLLIKPVLAASLPIIGKAVSLSTGSFMDFADYGSNVRVSWSNGNFEGYAFSEDLGWIAFGTTDNPEGPVHVDTSTGLVTGKATVLATGAYLDFTNYSSNVTVNTSTGVLSGYVWSEDIGWLNFGSPGVNIDQFSTDLTEPVTNASAITMQSAAANGYPVADGEWTKSTVPAFSWTPGADNTGGSGLRGYCLYLGTDPAADPGNSVTLTGTSGILTNSPLPTVGTNCLFITASTSLDLGSGNYLSSPFVDGSTYYLRIKAIDNAGNTYNTSAAAFSYKYDETAPTNVSYISCASGSFSNVVDMSFNWPVTGSAMSADANSGVLGWQYQINSTSGTWLGVDTGMNINYIATGSATRTLTQAQDGASIINGTNVVYFRTVDKATNFSSDATIRTCNLEFGGQAPSFGATDTVSVTPSTSTTNSFALSWPSATPTFGQSVSHYYYMVNTSPPLTLNTLQSNVSTYLDNGTEASVSASALPNINKGTNTIYVVAVDDAGNYSPSNKISGTFTLNSTDPDNAGNLVASDSSIKSTSQWNVTLTWTVPSYQGAGNLTYIVKRSTDNATFTQVGATTGLSYVDNTPSSTLYYYKVYTEDGASAVSSGTNAVSITPTGRWTVPPTLDSGPDEGSISVRKATITWTTSRTSDSKIQYGTTSGIYNSVEPSSSSQVSAHSIQLSGLNPSTTYYYRAKWTDEDGNTGTSDEKSFTTASAPSAKDVTVTGIGLSSALINYTVSGASSVKIYYGTTTSFGGATTLSTSTSESSYTTQLSGLEDGTRYYYKINTFDSDGTEYDGTVLDFTTLPRPKISSVRLQEVTNTAQPTILVSWTTNTAISSIVTYYPEGSPENSRDSVSVDLVSGEHQMIIRGLFANTKYILLVKGVDKIGNEAASDAQKFATSTDSRPPIITNLHIEGTTIPPTASTAQESKAQLIVSWDTDEPATSQVEFGQGTGVSYQQRSQLDSNYTYNHMVVISGLTPSTVYHLRTLSTDKAGNIGQSIDTVTITPKPTANALDLVITNLQSVFGFLGGIKY